MSWSVHFHGQVEGQRERGQFRESGDSGHSYPDRDPDRDPDPGRPIRSEFTAHKQVIEPVRASLPT